jgi:hypothetical protein
VLVVLEAAKNSFLAHFVLCDLPPAVSQIIYPSSLRCTIFLSLENFVLILSILDETEVQGTGSTEGRTRTSSKHALASEKTGKGMPML